MVCCWCRRVESNCALLVVPPREVAYAARDMTRQKGEDEMYQYMLYRIVYSPISWSSVVCLCVCIQCYMVSLTLFLSVGGETLPSLI